VREGSEEYLDSEKYEVKERRLDGPLLPMVQRLNEIRRAEPALQRVDNLRWLETEQERLVAYLKDDLVVVVNLDPLEAREGLTIVPAALGVPPTFFVSDLLGGERYRWTIGRNFVRLEPGQGHVFKIQAHV
jgi:starch synthase (maltosyl-transferring)